MQIGCMLLMDVALQENPVNIYWLAIMTQQDLFLCCVTLQVLFVCFLLQSGSRSVAVSFADTAAAKSQRMAEYKSKNKAERVCACTKVLADASV